MTVKERTLLFNLCVIIYNIILGLIVEGAFFILFLLFMGKFPNLGESVYFQLALPILMLFGLVAAILISTRTVRAFIKKFHLEDKLSEKVIEHYKKD